MDRNQAKEFYPILKAYAEGKIIECRTKPSALSKSWRGMNDWTEMKEIEFWINIEYRIKPDSKAKAKFRPFANAEECWAEMLKHEPFGWLKVIGGNVRTEINYIHNEGAMFSCGSISFERMFANYAFADGTPFGILEEE